MRPIVFLAFLLSIGNTLPAQIDDAGFEPPQVAGLQPRGPWSSLNGSSWIAPAPPQQGRFFDAGFPTAGACWLDLSTEGTGPAAAVSPCDPSQGLPGPGTVCELRQSFVADASGVISFQWTWISAETFPPTFNDFASVDVVDPQTGTPIVNLLFIDNGVGTVPVNAPGAQSNGFGGVVFALSDSIVGSNEVAPLGPKTASVPVPMLIPGNTYELCLVAGNDGDGLVPSHLYLDAFTPAMTEVPPSNQINGPAASLRASGLSCRGIGSFPEQRSLDPGAAFTLTIGSESSGRQPFALFATLGLGTVGGAGIPVPPGRVDLDLFAVQTAPPGTLVRVIDGIAPRDFADVLLGDTGAPGRRSFNFAMPAAGTGTLASVQAVCLAPAAAVGSALSAATQLDYRESTPLPAAFVGSQTLSLGNDAVTQVVLPAGLNLPFYGASYSTVMVSSNGILSFGANGQLSGFASASGFLGGEPAIAPLWSNLDPASGGTVAWSGTGQSLVVSWSAVPQSVVGGSNDAAARLESSGLITLRWGAVSATGALIGISPGIGSPVGAAQGSSRDWSAVLGATISGLPDEALFEHFGGAACDLPACLPLGPTSALTFMPRSGPGLPGNQGYDAL